MYKEVNGNLRMTVNEASTSYPNSIVLMKMESRDSLNPIGTILFEGDCYNELFELQVKLNIPYGLVVEGINRQQNLGGLFFGS